MDPKHKAQLKYKKGGSAGVEGILFQVNLLTVVLLNALEKFATWRISTEDVRGGKFDDIVLELPDGAVLFQAKHRKNRKVSTDELFSINSKNNDFSLGKYFFSYQEIKARFRIKYIIICTNTDIKMGRDMQQFFVKQRQDSDSVLYLPTSDSSLYKLDKKILPYLREHIESYQSENLNKNVAERIITNQDITEFIEHLQLCCNYPSGDNFNKTMEQLLTETKYCNNLCYSVSSKYIHNKVLDWFRDDKGVYWTELDAKAIFCELKSNKYCETLEQFNVFFKDNNLGFEETKQIFHLAVKDGHFLNIIKLYRALEHKCKKHEVLFVSSSDGVKVIQRAIDAFALPRYSFLIIIWPRIEEDDVEGICSKLGQILNDHEYKKAVFVREADRCQDEILNSAYERERRVGFKDLTKNTQSRLLKNKNVVFQGEDTSLEQLLSSEMCEYYENIVSNDVLEKLIKAETIVVGSPVKPLNHHIKNYYIHRKFNRKTDKIQDEDKEETFTEEDMCYIQDRVILIADSAGTGKTTVLTNLAVEIKNKFPNSWIIRIELNDATTTLQKFRSRARISMTITDLLGYTNETKLNDQFELFVFSMNRRVVLMLDGVDEISPDYMELVLNLLMQCKEAPNIKTIFVTSRLHTTEELEKRLYVKSFTLQPFTRENQIDFLMNYWTHNLKLDKEKCKQYASALLNQMRSWINFDRDSDTNCFITIPLQIRMLGEIFQEKNLIEDSTDWEGCKEYLDGGRAEPKLPEKMSIGSLFHMFIERKRDIFIKKENPGGYVAANQTLIEKFDECLAYHRTLALRVILSRRQRGFFPSFPTDNVHLESYLLKIGIVQKSNERLHFIHRTFAEYFVAESLLIQLQQNNQSIDFQMFFIDELLVHRKFNVIRAFLDSLLRDIIDSLSRDTFQTYHSFTFNILKEHNPNLIHHLAGEGCVEILRLILKCLDFKIIRGREVNVADFYKVSKVRMLLYFGRTLHFLQHLLRQGGINIKDSYGDTPVHFAVRKGHLKMVKFLVERGASVNIENVLGHTALWGPVPWKKNYKDIIEFLIDNGVDINKRNSQGDIVLCFNCLYGSFRTITVLVEFGADVNAVDVNGRPVLHAVILNGNLETVKFLVERGADVNVKNSDGRTMLHAAALIGNLDIVKFLVDCGVDLNVQDENGLTVLHVAISMGNLDIFKFLVERGADLNSCNDY